MVRRQVVILVQAGSNPVAHPSNPRCSLSLKRPGGDMLDTRQGSREDYGAPTLTLAPVLCWFGSQVFTLAYAGSIPVRSTKIY